jgi:mono/diheme cytochrome c family protein
MKGIFEYFNKKAATAVETRNYGPIYFALSALLFVGTMWAVLDEVSTRRPWKDVQEQYYKLSIEKWEQRMNDATAAIDSSSLADAKKTLDSANAAMQSPAFKALDDQIYDVGGKLIDANRNYTFAKSKNDEAYYFWKKSVHEGNEDAGYRDKVTKLTAQMVQLNGIVDSLTAEQDSLQKIEASYRLDLKNAKLRLAGLTLAVDNAKAKIDKARTAAIGIKQVMLNNFDLSNFGIPKARIDRCQTCHMGWKDENMDSAAAPYTRHPFPELLNLHKPETFGCTPCHHGQGTALTAGDAHGDADPYWEWPLLKGKEVYASCEGCHSNRMYLPGGDKFNKSKQIVEESGCFGCHDIKGFNEEAQIGPNINQMTAKAQPDWIFRWVRNPKDYNPHTRMPNFRFTDEQAEQITAFLVNVSKENPYHVQKGISAGGNAAHGKDLVGSVGCKGCHVIGDDTRMRDARGFSYDIAPELTRAGSKLDPDWMFAWIKNPRQFRPNTRMPDLRLTDQEAKDIVAYLSTMKDDRQFEQKSLALDSPENIKAGDKLIRDYGCHGCHDIQGMEKEQRVSVSLSNLGRKRVDEIDFGDTHVPHTWNDWVFNKLKDSRMYATDRIASKMPVFAFADSEIVEIRTLLRGMTKDVPGEDYEEPYTKIPQAIEAGRRLTHYYNCINCHQIEELGGYVKATVEDEALAPPLLRPEGSKVQEEWLHNFLNGPTPIRPWLTLRMPTFHVNDSEITTITKYFLAMHDMELEMRNYGNFSADPTLTAAGGKLFDEFQCLQCHYTGKIPEGKTPSDLAPNLAMAKNRLKPEWILQWIAKPDSIQPGTKMPGFFPDMQSPDPSILGGDAKAQIRALRDHVYTIIGSK